MSYTCTRFYNNQLSAVDRCVKFPPFQKKVQVQHTMTDFGLHLHGKREEHHRKTEFLHTLQQCMRRSLHFVYLDLFLFYFRQVTIFRHLGIKIYGKYPLFVKYFSHFNQGRLLIIHFSTSERKQLINLIACPFWQVLYLFLPIIKRLHVLLLLKI